MSSRVLRKLQGGDKELVEEGSDNDNELPSSGGARRKQLNINRYDLLNQLSHSESEVKEDDNETEAVKRKKKKKKKKSGKSANVERSSEDNADIDEVERSVREVNKLLGESIIARSSSTGSGSKVERHSHSRKNILSIQHKHLNPQNELKRIFGSKIIQSEHKRKNRGQRGHVKNTWLVSGKENWPPVSKTGLTMSLVDTKHNYFGPIQYFTYEHSTYYRQIQNRFLDAVDSLNPDNIVAIINDHPYHIDAMIQVSDLCKLSEDFAMAAELIERALYCLECAFHPSFNVTQGQCRLDYKRQENRALFITVFKHLLNVGSRACYRTALEFCKLLLSLDPDDPLAVKLAVDFYALRAKEYRWLIDLFTEWEPTKNLSQLPNFAFSVPIAYFHTANGDTAVADSLLQDALIMFPGVLQPLLEKCSVQIDARVQKHDFFGSHTINKQPLALTQLINLYVHRSYHVWKECDLLPWLEKNVHEVLDRVDRKDPLIKEYEAKRGLRYQGNLPRSIARHIVLSDIKGVTINHNEETSGAIVSFDPLPPLDSINIYTKSKKPRTGNTQSSPLSMLFRSLLPNFNANDIPVDLLEEEDGARALPEDEPRLDEDLRNRVTSLVGAVRDLLSNIRLPDVPVDADVDENDDSDDDEQNNYLT
ncbi:PREDICTED: transcription factor 25 [Nicrophorus vespilloides]|uniref:Transcription factor 25 n=1 Tax=Nicrophorus vespilloides TaxID=110193 RepID=A0ABM1N2P0_NICVS|nr:PREDICTED: transcription factor 25 [Nicrophorus vespilloides]